MSGSWPQIGFETRLDEWIETERPDDQLRRLVVAWCLTRLENPYEGMRRETDFPNLWFGPVPGSYDPLNDSVLVCSLWIEEGTRTVRCDRIGTLGFPI